MSDLLRLLKTIAVVGLFRERSGLASNEELLLLALPHYGAEDIADGLARLREWSLVIYRKFDDSYSVFDGSDFDIEDAVGQALESIGEVDFNRLEALAGLQPHRGQTALPQDGRTALVRRADRALGWGCGGCQLIRPSGTGASVPSSLRFRPKARQRSRLVRRCRAAARAAADWDIAVGLPQGPWDINALVRELLALEQVRDEAPELQGDRVARREIEGRTSYLQGYLEGELMKAFDSASWHRKGRQPKPFPRGKLNGLASDLGRQPLPGVASPAQRAPEPQQAVE